MELLTRKVARGSLYLLIDYAFMSLIGYIFWFVVAKLTSSHEVGLASTAIALSTLLFLFANLGLPTAASKYIAEYNAKGMPTDSNAVYRTVIKISLLSGSIVAFLIIILSKTIAINFYQSLELIALIGIAAISIPFRTLTNSLNGSYQGSQRMEYCIVGDGIMSMTKLLVAIGFLIAGFGALGAVLGTTFGFIASAALGILLLAPRILPKTGTKTPLNPVLSWAQIIAFSLPIYVGTLMWTANTQVIIILLGMFVAMSEVAYFTIAFLIAQAIIGFLGSVSIALLPAVSEAWATGQKERLEHLFDLSIRLPLFMCGPLVIGILLFPNQILSLISPEYAAAATVLQVLGVAAVFAVIAGSPNFSVVNAFLNGIGKTRLVMAICATATVIAIGGSLVSLPLIGTVGAAVSVMTGVIVSTILGVIILKTKIHLNLKLQSLMKPFLCMTLTVVVADTIAVITKNLYFTILVAAIAYATCTLVSKTVTWTEIKILFHFSKGFLNEIRGRSHLHKLLSLPNFNRSHKNR